MKGGKYGSVTISHSTTSNLLLRPLVRAIPTMASSSQHPSNLKLLLIGNSSVGVYSVFSIQYSCNTSTPSNSIRYISGKSSLLLRFTDDDFLSEEETAATIGVDFKVKILDVDGKRYKLSIWVSSLLYFMTFPNQYRCCFGETCG